MLTTRFDKMMNTNRQSNNENKNTTNHSTGKTTKTDSKEGEEELEELSEDEMQAVNGGLVRLDLRANVLLALLSVPYLERSANNN